MTPNPNDPPQTGPQMRAAPRKPKQTPVDRIPVESAELLGDVAKAEKSPLDDISVRDMHQKMLSNYVRELDVQARWRRDMHRDEAMFDNDQWDAEDIAVLKERGQDPLVFNVIAQSINWIIGSQRRARTDFKVLPRSKGGARGAEKKSQLLKYLSDVNSSAFDYSDAFAEAVKSGLSWLESGVQEDTQGEPIYERYESWRNMVIDSVAREKDLSDSRYMFRSKWVDLDTATAMFPKRAAMIKEAASTYFDFGSNLDSHGDEAMDSIEYETSSESYSSLDTPKNSRSRVRLIEAWFRVPCTEKVIAGGDFSGEIYDEHSPGHADTVAAGLGEVRDRLTFRMYVMVMTTTGALWFSKSPYRHNEFPFTPIFINRKSSDGSPYGIIRNMVDAQKDINKRFSKALAIISSNKVIMDEGAVKDLDQFEEEIARPNAIIVKASGKELTINADRELSVSHLNIMQMSMQMIQSLSGVTDEAMGRQTNASSGKAIGLRQDQAVVSTSNSFDNFRYTRLVHGAKMLSLTEQFMTEEKQFRITNARGGADYVTINDGLPENDIVRTKADYVISEDDWNASLRQGQVQELLAVIAQLAPVEPRLVMVMLDLIVEAMDIPSRDELVKRIRQITGMEDPDADPNVPDPERDARKAAQAAQQEMEQRAAIANISKMEGDAELKKAQAQKVGVDIAKTVKGLVGDDIAAQRAALELAIASLQAEPAVNVADAILKQSGHTSPIAESMPEEAVEPVVLQQPPAPQAQQPQPV